MQAGWFGAELAAIFNGSTGKAAWDMGHALAKVHFFPEIIQAGNVSSFTWLVILSPKLFKATACSGPIRLAAGVTVAVVEAELEEANVAGCGAGDVVVSR